MAADDFTTPANVFTYLRADSTAQAADAELMQLIVSHASDVIRAYCNRDFAAATDFVLETYDGHGTPRLMLRHWPINSVDKVVIQGADVPKAPLGYDMSYGWYILSDRCIALRGGAFPCGCQNVQVSYNAGGGARPAVERACIRTAAHWYKEIERLGNKSKTIAAQTVLYDTDSLPAEVVLVLDNVRDVVPD